MEHGDFSYKLWLTKHLPWIVDVSGYFTNWVCKDQVQVYMRPSGKGFEATCLLIDESNHTLNSIAWYGDNHQHHQIPCDSQSYRIIGKYNEKYEWDEEDTRVAYEYYDKDSKDVKIIVYPF